MHSVIKETVANELMIKDLGPPEWSKQPEAYGMRQVDMGPAWLGKIDCGNLQLVSMPGPLPVPIGTCGILGLDFLRLFDWDLDVAGGTAQVATVPKDMEGPVPFDLEGLRAVPLMTVRPNSGFQLLACPAQVKKPGEAKGVASVQCMGVIDLGAAKSLCNNATVAAMQLGQEDIRDTGTTIPGIDGSPTALREANLKFLLGKDVAGPVEVEVEASVADVEVFQTMGLAGGPVVILGLDVLARSRLILSLRLNGLWITA